MTNATNKIPVGYQAICEVLNFTTLPHFRESYITMQGRGKTEAANNHEVHIYPKTYALQKNTDLWIDKASVIAKKKEAELRTV